MISRAIRSRTCQYLQPPTPGAKCTSSARSLSDLTREQWRPLKELRGAQEAR